MVVVNKTNDSDSGEIEGDSVNGYYYPEYVLRIPEGIKDIGDYASANNEKIIGAVLPESLESIGRAAFISRIYARKIIVYAKTLPKLNFFTFWYGNGGLKIYVPAESIAPYIRQTRSGKSTLKEYPLLQQG